MTPAATQLKFRLDQRRLWFINEWLFKWHYIGGERAVEIDTFDGRMARYAGIKYDGSAYQIFWQTITRGVRKEIVEQFAWIEERVRFYARVPAEAAIDECAALLTAFVNSMRRAATDKDRILRGNGVKFPPAHDAGNWSEVSPEAIALQATELKAALFPQVLKSQHVEEPALERNSSAPTYQVALSFAGEQRQYVEAVAHALRERHVLVFYDQFETATLWGKDGVEFFHKLFSTDASYVVMFISKEYIEKKWPRHERRAALSRAIEASAEYLLPVRFDDSAVPGLPDTVQYVKAENFAPEALADLISQKLSVPPPLSFDADETTSI